MEKIFFSVPFVFLLILAFIYLVSFLLSRLAFISKKKSSGTGESYACGEDNYDHMAQPNYSQFFSFAFFFTIAHVATLVLTTVPQVTPKILVLALIYLVGVIVGLSMFLRSRL